MRRPDRHQSRNRLSVFSVEASRHPIGWPSTVTLILRSSRTDSSFQPSGVGVNCSDGTLCLNGARSRVFGHAQRGEVLPGESGWVYVLRIRSFAHRVILSKMPGT